MERKVWWKRLEGRPEDDHPNSRWLRIAPLICIVSFIVAEIGIALVG